MGNGTGRPGRRVAALVVTAALVAVLVAGLALVQHLGNPPAAAPRGTTASASGDPTTAPASPAPTATKKPRRRTGPPAITATTSGRLLIGSLGVDAPVIPVSAPGQVLLPPSDPQVLGWWKDGAAPGARTGSALVTGHTVHTGGGALDDLDRMKVGQRLTFKGAGAPIDYRVVNVRTYHKQTLAHDAASLFSQSVPGRLVVITCEDWNGTAYLSNVVVTAEPVS